MTKFSSSSPDANEAAAAGTGMDDTQLSLILQASIKNISATHEMHLIGQKICLKNNTGLQSSNSNQMQYLFCISDNDLTDYSPMEFENGGFCVVPWDLRCVALLDRNEVLGCWPLGMQS